MDTMQEMISYIKITLLKVFSPSTTKFAGAFFYVIYSFFLDPGKGQGYLALLFLILFDFVTGVRAAKKCGDAIRSSKVRHSAIKIAAYFSVISGANLAEKGLFSYIGILDETVLAFFLVTELISLIENVGRMGYQTPQKILNQAKALQDKL